MKTKSIPLKQTFTTITLCRLLLLCTLFFVSEISEAQCYKDFKYAIGTTGADEAFDIVDAGYGNFFVIGTTSDATGKNILVTKMNAGGAILWTKVYGGSGTETVKKASATHDNGLLITGSTGSFANSKGDIMCLKLDNDGNLVWLRKFGVNSPNGDVGMDITETKDGGYAVAGTLNALSSGADMIVLKLDANANITWNKRFHNAAIANGIGVIENGNALVVTSEVQSPPGADYESVITEIDEANGNILNAIKIHPATGGLSNAYIFKDASNNGYWISGHLTDKLQASKMQQIILKLGANYAITKTYKLVMPEYANNGYSGFQSLQSGGFIACAGQESKSSGFIYSIRKDGSIGFAKKLVGGKDRKLNRLQLIGNKIISVGSDARSGNQEMFLIAFDSSGATIPPCQTDTADLTVQSHSFTTGSYAWVSISAVSFASVNGTFTTKPIELNKTLLCSIACTVDTFPTVDFIKPDTICVNTPVTIINKTTDGKSFAWNFNADANINVPDILSSSDSIPPVVTYNTAGIYKISLIVNKGLTTQTSVSKNIVVLASPYKTTVTDTSFCGDSMVLKTIFPAGTFVWNDGTGNNELTIRNTGTYWVETNYYGCVIKDSIHVLKGAPIKIDLLQDTTICAGTSIQLLAQATNYKSYSWTPANTLSDGSSKNPIATPRETTIYTLNVKDVNGCEGTDSIKVTVASSPFVITIQDTTVCSSDKVKLSTISSPDVTYSWSPSFGLSNTSEGAVIAMPGFSRAYTVTVTAPNGCTASDSVYLNVQQSPAITAGTTDTLICSGTNVHLAAMSSSPVTYKWSPSLNLDDASSATPVAKPSATTNYIVEATSANGCKVYDSVLVSVKQVHAFSIEPSLITVCAGTPVTLKATGGDTYNWFPSKTISATEGAVVTVKPSTSTEYKVVVKDTACAVSDTLTATVNIAGVATAHVTKSNDVDCMLPSSILKAAAGGIKYRWFPATGLSDSTIANPVASPLQTTTYHVEITNAGGCTTIDSVTVNVYKGSAENGYRLPTAFTPNNDGNNDCFGVRKWGAVSSIDFSIYNRSGNLVFHTTNPSDCWDGTYKGVKQAYGTYIYVIRAQVSCGVVNRKGTVVLLR